MSTHEHTTPTPNDDPMLQPADALPVEEDIDEAQADEQLDTEPDEARNATDGYAPEDDEPDDD